MPNTDPRFLAVLTVKNEGAFLIDWLAHHRAVGFTDILVLSNDCTDGTDAMLDRMQAMGWLTHIRNDGPHPKGPQWSALKLAGKHPLRKVADWLLVLDIDAIPNCAAPNVAPGTVVESPAGELHVRTGDGVVAIRMLQPSGKRVMPAAEFLRGNDVQPGAEFGAPSD